MGRIAGIVFLFAAAPAYAGPLGDYLTRDARQQQVEELQSRVDDLESRLDDMTSPRAPLFSKAEADAFLKRIMDDVAKKQAASRNCTGLCPSEY